MKKEDLYRAMDGIEDNMLEEAEKTPVMHGAMYRRILTGVGVMAAVLLMVMNLPFRGAGSAAPDGAQEEAAVEASDAVTEDAGESEMKYETEYNTPAEAREYSTDESFYAKTLFLIDSPYENRLISPLNLYNAFSLLAECTAGETRQEILDTLGVPSVEELRIQNAERYAANNVQQEELTSQTANSVWLSDAYMYNDEALDSLRNYYHADVTTGTMGSGQMDGALQSWLNEHTGDLLQESVSRVKLPPETVLSLASALYYKASWTELFQEELTTDVFHAPGGDEQITYLARTDDGGTLYSSDVFTAVCLPLSGGGDVWVYLPEEGYSTADVLHSQDALRLVNGETACETETGDLHIRIPEFDVTCDTSLLDALPVLGITHVLETGADFTPITDESLVLSSIQHAARFMAEEEGVTGAAYTVMVFETAVQDPEEHKDLYFTADRPFVFFVTGSDGSLLFAGTVNEPVQ